MAQAFDCLERYHTLWQFVSLEVEQFDGIPKMKTALFDVHRSGRLDQDHAREGVALPEDQATVNERCQQFARKSAFISSLWYGIHCLLGFVELLVMKSNDDVGLTYVGGST